MSVFYVYVLLNRIMLFNRVVIRELNSRGRSVYIRMKTDVEYDVNHDVERIHASNWVFPTDN